MLIEVIAPTYDRTVELKSAIASMIAQTDQEWLLHVIIDNEDNMPAMKIVKDFNDKRIRTTHMDKRYNDWGHTPREYGKQASGADYIVMGSDDFYYVPTFIEEVKKAIQEQGSPELIYWDMIHSHYGYSFFRCSPWMNQIDIGAFATRADKAKQIKLKTTYAADGEFIEEFKVKFPNANMFKINKVLYVHN